MTRQTTTRPAPPLESEEAPATLEPQRARTPVQMLRCFSDVEKHAYAECCSHGLDADETVPEPELAKFIWRCVRSGLDPFAGAHSSAPPRPLYMALGDYLQRRHAEARSKLGLTVTDEVLEGYRWTLVQIELAVRQVSDEIGEWVPRDSLTWHPDERFYQWPDGSYLWFERNPYADDRWRQRIETRDGAVVQPAAWSEATNGSCDAGAGAGAVPAPAPPSVQQDDDPEGIWPREAFDPARRIEPLVALTGDDSGTGWTKEERGTRA